MNLKELNFPAHNAVFHISKGLIFNRTIAFRVRALYPDKNDKNVYIQNKERLKKRLFEKIMVRFNNRLRATTATTPESPHNFTEDYKKRMLISNEKLDIFKLQMFQLSSGMEDEFNASHIGGDYAVYPLTFVCEKCGDLRSISQGDIDKFNPNSCMINGCSGRYEQLSLMLFCPICGNVRPFQYYYKGENITLIRGSKDSISTWKVKAKSKPSIDLFRLMCDHMDPFDMGPYKSRKTISLSDSCSQKPLTVTEGSIYIPVAQTSIDIPSSPDIDLEDLEYILSGITLGKYDFLESLGLSVDIATIQDLYANYNNLTVKKITIRRDPLFKGKSEEDQEKEWKKKCLIDKIEEVITEIKSVYPEAIIETLREINDYSALIGKLGTSSIKSTAYLDYISTLNEPLIKSEKKLEFAEIQRKYHIQDIIHIPRVTLVNSCYGIFNGINKFYDEDFVPHFDPIWVNRTEANKGFYAYCFPYETEGIIITLNKERILEWLVDTETIPVTNSTPKEFFNSLEPESKEYAKIEVLLHSFSHLLMRSSSVYTGLDLQSYGENIFPASAAIFLFTTSSINIGGLQFVFEHEIFNWFENMLFDVKECTLDPNCIKEKGTCFSCMYIPEFVCCKFNQHLDRDVFLGKSDRNKKGFWW
ncbi:hypothetical protein LCGC14_1933250 [marine sediment metagenome]|uniref:DUF1998 domain-containing protein n=1 Tax=marine sediment metagenome TaxID=412755 RepID=A0A0F9I167_9ZZZZ